MATDSVAAAASPQNAIPVHASDVAAQIVQIADGDAGRAEATTATASSPAASKTTSQSKLSQRYRGATIQDLDPPPALSCSPDDTISHALLAAFERDYTYLTVVSRATRALLGYIAMPRLRALLDAGVVAGDDAVATAMVKFRRRRGQVYRVITMDTPLEELERFFEEGEREGEGKRKGQSDGGEGEATGQGFAVVTDDRRKFVLGIATRNDLDEFARRRPA